MERSLPPLNWVRAFAAAARHQGFAHAAEELGVSAGAISQHVKLLERRLGAELFERHPRGVRLTDAGKSYRDALRPALDAIAQASRQVSGKSTHQALRLVALPAVAQMWLTPRLSRFQAIAPQVAVQVTTAERIEPAQAQRFDVAVHYHAHPEYLRHTATCHCLLLTPQRAQSSRSLSSGYVRRARPATPVRFAHCAHVLTLDTLSLLCVHIREHDAPAKAKPLERFLLTTITIDSMEDAPQLLMWYGLRWRIENWHRVMKRGCRVERHAHDSALRLERAVAIRLVTAWRVPLLTLLGREVLELPAELLFS